MASTTPNSRASLLAGLRTGGVRSASQPFAVPHTAAPTGHFNIPRYVSATHPTSSFLDEDDEVDQLAQMTSHLAVDAYNSQQIPMTAAVADSNFLFQQQQQQLLLNHLAAQRASLTGNSYNSTGQQTDFRTQMMQMELLKYQVRFPDNS